MLKRYSIGFPASFSKTKLYKSRLKIYQYRLFWDNRKSDLCNVFWFYVNDQHVLRYNVRIFQYVKLQWNKANYLMKIQNYFLFNPFHSWRVVYMETTQNFFKSFFANCFSLGFFFQELETVSTWKDLPICHFWKELNGRYIESFYGFFWKLELQISIDDKLINQIALCYRSFESS